MIVARLAKLAKVSESNLLIALEGSAHTNSEKRWHNPMKHFLEIGYCKRSWVTWAMEGCTDGRRKVSGNGKLQFL